MSDENFPFGDPDGARADTADIMEGFVRFRGVAGGGGIATEADNRNIRVIVGKKGAGKTVYLRRLQMSTHDEDSVFSQKISSNIPNTSQILEFSETCEYNQITERWMEFWHNSIIASTMSLVLYKGYFSDYFDQKIKGKISKKYEKILPSTEVPRTVYETARFFLSKFNTGAKIEELLSSDLWFDMQYQLNEILKNAPPVFVYLDAVDEEFSNAPMEWHQCQKGLFLAVMRLLREASDISGRLHITICIRDIVFSSVLSGEHAGRYRDTPNICKLSWNRDRINYFFNRKIEKLPDEYFDDSSKEKNLENFLSSKEIYNDSKNINEPLIDYIVRHTRFLPRDIVEVGNELSRAKIGRKTGLVKDDESWFAIIRSIIASKSRNFATEQLRICSNQITAHERPAYAAHHRYSDFYTANQEYVEQRSNVLKEIITDFGYEKFEKDFIEMIREISNDKLKFDINLPSILWQNGLIGIDKSGSCESFKFFNLDDRDDFLLPDDAKFYAFHSCLNDVVKFSVKSTIPIVDRGLYQ